MIAHHRIVDARRAKNRVPELGVSTMSTSTAKARPRREPKATEGRQVHQRHLRAFLHPAGGAAAGAGSTSAAHLDVDP